MKSENNKTPGLYTAGLVLGIIAVCMFLNPIIAFICGLLAIIFGAITYSRKYKKIAPIILGLLGIIIAITEVVLIFAFKDQIKDAIYKKGKGTIETMENRLINTVEDAAKKQKDNLSEEAKEEINEVFEEAEKSLKEVLESKIER